MQFVTETIKSKAVVDGAEVVTKVVTTKILTPDLIPGIVKRHPYIASIGAYYAGKSLGESVRNRRNHAKS
jgi:ornithine cyclodeaminase/alanine dehydrogenase-like protein (mu-crystallin family)